MRNAIEKLSAWRLKGSGRHGERVWLRTEGQQSMRAALLQPSQQFDEAPFSVSRSHPKHLALMDLAKKDLVRNLNSLDKTACYTRIGEHR